VDGHELGERRRPVSDVTTTDPAPLLVGPDAVTLRDNLLRDVARVVNADPARDNDVLSRAVDSSMQRVAIRLDLAESYASLSALPAGVYGVLVGVGAALVKQPSSAFGAVGYDDADPMATRAIASFLADLVPGYKARWGLA
jgi:hypothetical protein